MDKETKKEFEKVNKSIENLTATTARGFKEADKKIADLAAITEKSINDLAAITARGFEHVDKRFEQVDKRFEQVDKRFDKMEGQISIMQDDIDQLSSRVSSLGHEVAEIHKNMVYRDEFDDLMGRMKYVEIRLGIESGK